MKASTAQDEIKSILERNTSSRDDDLQLLAQYWHEHIGIDSTIRDLLRAMKQGKIHSIGTVTRCRRKLQEQHEHLRGERYNARQTDEQGEMIKDIAHGF